jgi:hypothetical protein
MFISDIYAHTETVQCSRGSMSQTQTLMGLEEIKKTLGENHACYVLITCNESAASGEMCVQMDYEGDESLAAFLVNNAGQIFDERLSRKDLS